MSTSAIETDDPKRAKIRTVIEYIHWGIYVDTSLSGLGEASRVWLATKERWH